MSEYHRLQQHLALILCWLLILLEVTPNCVVLNLPGFARPPTNPCLSLCCPDGEQRPANLSAAPSSFSSVSIPNLIGGDCCHETFLPNVFIQVYHSYFEVCLGEEPPIPTLATLQVSLDTLLSNDQIANSMHHDGSVEVIRDDGKYVTCHCSVCKLDVQEKYRAGRGGNSHKTWPHPSWPKTKQHVKGHAHFKSYLCIHGAEDEPSFWDSAAGKSENEVNEMIKEEHRQRLGGRTRWAMKVLNQGSRAKKSASTSNGSAGGDVPTALPSTRPVPAQL